MVRDVSNYCFFFKLHQLNLVSLLTITERVNVFWSIINQAHREGDSNLATGGEDDTLVKDGKDDSDDTSVDLDVRTENSDTTVREGFYSFFYTGHR